VPETRSIPVVVAQRAALNESVKARLKRIMTVNQGGAHLAEDVRRRGIVRTLQRLSRLPSDLDGELLYNSIRRYPCSAACSLS